MSRKKFLCLDCRMDTGKLGEFYFIHTNLWLQVTSSINGMLCVGCLEKRLGRKLKKTDFTTAYINKSEFGSKSIRLQNRLKN